MSLYRIGNYLLRRGDPPKLAVAEACCCPCERCESMFVNDINAPTLTRYPRSAVVTLANIVKNGIATPCGPVLQDCGICASLNQSYICEIESMDSRFGNWFFKSYATTFPEHFAGANLIGVAT